MGQKWKLNKKEEYYFRDEIRYQNKVLYFIDLHAAHLYGSDRSSAKRCGPRVSDGPADALTNAKCLNVINVGHF